MAIPRFLDLYIDADRPMGEKCVLDGTSGAIRETAVQMMQGDIFTLRIHFRRRTGVNTASTAESITAGDVIVIAGKVNAAATATLFYQDSFTEVVDGADTYYQGSLSLAGSEIVTAIANASTLAAVVDLEVQNGDNTARITYRFEVTINAQVYKGTESTPTPSTPVYPAASALMVKTPPGGNYRFKDGNHQFWNPVTEKFHTIIPYGPEGAVTTSWGPGESA